jgi:hypothetical protein
MSSFVTVSLVDHGSSIETKEFQLKGFESQVVEETDLVKAYRKKGIIKTEPAKAPEAPKAKKTPQS